MGKIPEHQKTFLRHHAAEMTVKELAEKLGKKECSIYSYLYKHNIPFKHEDPRKKDGPYQTRPIDERYEPEEKKETKRPAAVYTNSTPYGIAGNY